MRRKLTQITNFFRISWKQIWKIFGLVNQCQFYWLDKILQILLRMIKLRENLHELCNCSFLTIFLSTWYFAWCGGIFLLSDSAKSCVIYVFPQRNIYSFCIHTFKFFFPYMKSQKFFIILIMYIIGKSLSGKFSLTYSRFSRLLLETSYQHWHVSIYYTFVYYFIHLTIIYQHQNIFQIFMMDDKIKISKI